MLTDEERAKIMHKEYAEAKLGPWEKLTDEQRTQWISYAQRWIKRDS